MCRLRIAAARPASRMGSAQAPAPAMASPLTIGSVADVVEGHQPPIGDAVINDQPGLLLIVEKQLGANTLQVTRDVEKTVEALRPGLKDVYLDTTIFRPATFIEMSLENLKNALIWGCILVAIILILFLFEWRTALISLTAIPLSLVTAALVLYWRGATLNTMVIAGLAIALGEVVDDAIIDVENVLRRLRQNEASGHPVPAWRVVLEASLEVRSAVVYATIIVVLVFIPVFFLEGLGGSFLPAACSLVRTRGHRVAGGRSDRYAGACASSCCRVRANRIIARPDSRSGSGGPTEDRCRRCWSVPNCSLADLPSSFW